MTIVMDDGTESQSQETVDVGRIIDSGMDENKNSGWRNSSGVSDRINRHHKTSVCVSMRVCLCAMMGKLHISRIYGKSSSQCSMHSEYGWHVNRSLKRARFNPN